LKNKEGGFLDSSSKDTSKNVELFFFYATWCPHCKTAKPIWEQVKKEYEGKNVNGYNLIFTDIDCTTESPDVEKMMNTYKIEGFPTIKMLKEGQVIEFDAKPTKSNIEKFINTVL
jgi:thiol-disulfide isomerase/thioredoxin